ncbi:GIY-YIG nuclease family protein [Bacillus testis]|uniref:GIY-YIG nuclease family protein n=1 Tax=Bacillus testis TaxID=1622072 RepID=UPI00067F4397|nr:GIY-YIG nuclease family protein [Bacillus testis]
MIKDINPDHSLYSIHYALAEERILKIGALGTFTFPAGNYVYIGSAKKHIEKRIERHMSTDKKLRWHIDYFRPACTVTYVKTYPENKGECALAAEFARHGSCYPKQFGSSDCRCGGHLIYLGPC